MYRVRFYGDRVDAKGRVIARTSPIRAFLNGLQGPERDAMVQALNTLEVAGPRTAPGLVKPIRGKLLELVGGQHGRIMFCFLPDSTIYLLHGFRKQTNETAERDRRLGLQRLAEVYPER